MHELPNPSQNSELNRKQKILAVTVDMLRQHEEVLVAEIARRAEVSVGLIYRHYGDLDHLVQEAWAVIFLNFELEDHKVLEDVLADPTTSTASLIEWFVGIFDPSRDASGWMRLEALVANRGATTPLPSVELIRLRIIDVYRELLTKFGFLTGANWSEDKIEAALITLTGLPLGITSMMPAELSDSRRHELARAAVRAALGVLELDPTSEQFRIK